jgi:excisionase family DNA binding protein
MTQHVVIVDEHLAELLTDLVPRLVDALERFEHPAEPTAGLTRAEAAAQLRVTSRHVDSMLASGELQCVRLGRKVIIPRSEIDRLLTPTARDVGRDRRSEPPTER